MIRRQALASFCFLAAIQLLRMLLIFFYSLNEIISGDCEEANDNKIITLRFILIDFKGKVIYCVMNMCNNSIILYYQIF